jgi:hypothetical protein
MKPLLVSSLPVLLGLLVVSAGCASASGSPTTSDGGKKSEAGMGPDAEMGPEAGRPATQFTTTCTPTIDLSKATQIAPPTTTVAPECLANPLPGNVAVVDSDAALRALFGVDGGVICGGVSLPTGVDYATMRVVVAYTGNSLAVYQNGNTAILDGTTDKFGADAGSEVFIVVLPSNLSDSVEVTTCTVTCSGNCPG